jgi:predicted metal-dependent HD superfamily phosphohydrolase
VGLIMDTSLSVWLEVTGVWGAERTGLVKIFNDLVSAYSSKFRHYHDVTHIEHMFSVANKVIDQAQDVNALYLAIWFHDCIQKIGRDSEQLSADFAEAKLIEINAPVALVNKVVALILATKHSNRSNITRELKADEQLISDIDLCILGSTRVDYQYYVKECRKEYPITDFIYKRGRKRFLQQMGERSHIFLTDYFKERFEALAFENIKFEINSMN